MTNISNNSRTTNKTHRTLEAILVLAANILVLCTSQNNIVLPTLHRTLHFVLQEIVLCSAKYSFSYYKTKTTRRPLTKNGIMNIFCLSKYELTTIWNIQKLSTAIKSFSNQTNRSLNRTTIMNENITSTMKKSRTAKKHNHAFSNNHFEMKKIKRKVANFGKKGDFAQRTGGKRRKITSFLRKSFAPTA